MQAYKSVLIDGMSHGARPRAVLSLKCDRMIACLFLLVQLTTGLQVSGQCEWADGFDIHGLSGSASALTVFDDGTGPALYAGGNFTMAGGVSASRIAKWNGSAWSPLGSGVDSFFGAAVLTLTVFDDGTGPALYAGGFFTGPGGNGADNIAKWNGSAWSPLGNGLRGSDVYALTVFDDGTGPALYAGGSFTAAASFDRIAKWNGSVWSPLGSGMNADVRALTVFDDGTGPALYAGGGFTTAGGVSANGIAKWNGSTWSPLGSGMSFMVSALTIFDDGTGPALYAGGSFTTAGTVNAKNIAKWNGLAWSPLGSGIAGLPSAVFALTVFDDGTGPGLYVGGLFTTAGGVSANAIARWNGSSWSPLGTGMGGGHSTEGPQVYALTVFDDGTGSALYAGGGFTTAGGKPSVNIGAWRLPLIGDCDGDDEVDLYDARFFVDCMTGPAVVVDALDVCRCADLSGDGFVDLRDAGLFMRLFGTSR